MKNGKSVDRHHQFCIADLLRDSSTSQKQAIMSNFSIPFQNDKQRVELATQISNNMLCSLENGVTECLRYPYTNTSAPTNAYSPAVMYCFSLIELFGSFYDGTSRGTRLPKGKGTSDRAKKYMIDLMNYSQVDAEKLQKIYRHKLAHLAIPKPAILYRDKYFSWKLHDPDPAHHLTTEQSPRSIRIGNLSQVDYDEIYVVNIMQLKRDITASVRSPGKGYLAALQKSQDLIDKI
jgi:hypothetical protein